MNIEITARHYEPSDRVKQHVEGELQQLKLFENLITSCKVILEKTKDGEQVEITLRVAGKNLLTKVNSDDMIKSIDQAVSKLERQLKKFKEKRYNR